MGAPSSRDLQRRKHSAPGTLMATPSAKTSMLCSLTRSPRAREMAMLLAPVGSTPITSTSCAAKHATLSDRGLFFFLFGSN